jgi:hypothetical protein
LLSRSVFNVEKKLSIAALSQQFPRRLMLHVMLCDSSKRWKFSLVYWADSTGRRNTFNQGGVYGATSGVDV